MTSGEPLTWIVGKGGLLGQHLEREMRTRWPLWVGARVPWDEAGAARTLSAQAREFHRATEGRSWQLVWAAGAGVTGTSTKTLEAELGLFAATLNTLGELGSGRLGTVFLASSAGGVYAGVGTPPYDENSPVRALSPYGDAKLKAEAQLSSWAQDSGTPALIGRIANLYGPGQNLAKAQGLISQMCRAHLTGQPLSVYVSLDTLRDYIFAPDCARLVADALTQLHQDQNQRGDTLVRTKVLASQRAVTIGAVLGEMRRIFKRVPRIVVGSSPVSAFQAKDLSLRSVVWPHLDRQPLTPLPAGIHATVADLHRRMQAGWSSSS